MFVTAGVLNFTITSEHLHEVSFFGEYGRDVIYRYYLLDDGLSIYPGAIYTKFSFALTHGVNI